MGSNKGNTRVSANRPSPRTPQAADAKKATKAASPKTEVKPKNKGKNKKEEKVVIDETPDDEEEAVEQSTPIEELEKPKRAKRPPPTKEEILATFEDIIEANATMIATLQADPNKPKGVIMFLKSQNKTMRALKGKVSRVAKKRVARSTDSTSSSHSGFSIPVKISAELAKFTGWDPNEPKSRIEVTKKVCEYIRVHNLQDPTDKRIIKPDEKLRKLLKYDPNVVRIGKDGKPEKGLTYYRLQTYMKPHYIN